MTALGYPDLASYLSALELRKGRTIIVEGATDKRALTRAVHEFEREGRLERGSVLIDPVDLVDGVGSGVGDRERVEELQRETRAAGHLTFALVDREFREFRVAADVADECRSHREQTPSQVVWTRGHSIENYFFEVEYVQEYVRFRYPDRASADAIDAIARHWEEALRNAAALSIAAFEAGLLARLGGALSIDVWTLLDHGGLSLDAAKLEQAALARGASPLGAATFRRRFEKVLSIVSVCEDAECPRWIAHGHLGDEVLWLGVGRVLLSAGVDGKVANEVAVGYRDEKRFHRAERWAQLHRGERPGVPTPTPLWRAVGVRI